MRVALDHPRQKGRPRKIDHWAPAGAAIFGPAAAIAVALDQHLPAVMGRGIHTVEHPGGTEKDRLGRRDGGQEQSGGKEDEAAHEPQTVIASAATQSSGALDAVSRPSIRNWNFSVGAPKALISREGFAALGDIPDIDALLPDPVTMTEHWLSSREPRPCDHARENAALLALADEMAQRPDNVLNLLCELNSGNL